MIEPTHAAPPFPESPPPAARAESAPASPGVSAASATRIARAAMSDADRRVHAQQHLDARSQRLSDYADSLRAALDTAPPTSDRAAVLQRRLDQARQDLAAAGRSRLADATTPRARSARVRLIAG